MSNAVLTTTELAKRWKMHPRSLEQWRQQKKGPKYIKLENGLVRYDINDIREYEEFHKKLLRQL